jgi:hypothetical protein
MAKTESPALNDPAIVALMRLLLWLFTPPLELFFFLNLRTHDNYLRGLDSYID